MNEIEYPCCYCGKQITLNTAKEHQKTCKAWQWRWGKPISDDAEVEYTPFKIEDL